MNAGSAVLSPAFIDSNIWLYAFSKSQDEQKSQQARALIRGLSQIALSTQVVNEVSVNLLRKFQADERDIRKLVRSFYRKHLIVEVDRATLLQASEIRIAYQISYWDSVIVASALAVNASVLYSEDMHNGLVVNDRLPIVNPLQT
ncbi:PIN domain-containing protein [bacterium]|nr:PIN domain-containing protein [bacterium]